MLNFLNNKNLLIIFISLISFFFLFYAVKINYLNHSLDSAVFVSNISKTYSFFWPFSQINHSAILYIKTSLPILPANGVCEIVRNIDTSGEVNMIDRHLYLMTFILAPLNRLLSAESIASFFHVFSYLGTLILIYYYLRKKKVGIFASSLFILLIVSYAGWHEGLYGQFYFDKLSIFPVSLICLLIYERVKNNNKYNFLLFLTIFFSILLSERVALMIGVFIFSLTFLYGLKRKFRKDDILLICISLFIILYALAYIFFIQMNIGIQDTKITFFEEIYDFFYKDGIFFYKLRYDTSFNLSLTKFLIVNSPFLFLLLFNWRISLIVLFIMLPNIFGDIGGAEKIGWSTHYHSIYMPYLIAASCIGFINFLNSFKLISLSVIKYLIIFLFTIISFTNNAYSLNPLLNIDFSQIKENGAVKLYGITLNKGANGNIMNYKHEQNKIMSDLLPKHTSISTSEGYFPSLISNNREIHLYPLNFGKSEYLVLNYNELNIDGYNSDIVASGEVSFLDFSNKIELSQCLNNMIKNEYMLIKKIPFTHETDWGTVVYKKKL